MREILFFLVIWSLCILSHSIVFFHNMYHKHLLKEEYAMEKGLVLNKISKTYQDVNGEVLAIKDFSYSFNQGDFVSIVGPSGCGKSTLLSIIAGLESPSTGNVFLDEEDITGKVENIGYMLQKDYLLDWRTVYKNVLIGLEIKNMLNAESKKYALDLLKMYGLRGIYR